MSDILTDDLDNLYQPPIKVLDHGFIRLVDHMGDDNSIVQAARVSYGQGSKGVDADTKLIKYLLDNKHWSPFEQVVFKFHVKLPIFVARQWMRHRDNFNEISYRFSQAEEEYYTPEFWRKQSTKNKQGSDLTNEIVKINAQEATDFMYTSNHIDEDGNTDLNIVYNDYMIQSFKFYEEILKTGVAREMARMVLPVSIYTQFYWTVHLRSLINFINLREDSHAQWEIQQYAKAIKQLIKPYVPIVLNTVKEK